MEEMDQRMDAHNYIFCFYRMVARLEYFNMREGFKILYRIGADEEFMLSHLQFIDDTLVLDEKIWVGVRALKAILILFELHSRITTRDNLVSRGMLEQHSIVCVGECDLKKAIQHLLFECPIFGQIWGEVLVWLWIKSALQKKISLHVRQIECLFFGDK